MSWVTMVVNDVLSEFTPAEKTILDGIQAGASTNLTAILGRAIAEVRGAIAGGGYPLGAAGTIPDALASDVIAIARWRFLVAMPALAKLQTKERKDAFDGAQEKLKAVSRQEYAVEAPVAGTNPGTGQWNSENKLVMRTHPVPRPGTQFQGTTGKEYGNPDGPQDQS